MAETEFGPYRLIDELGRGAMGQVYRAYDTGTERIVALKVLAPNLAQDERFQQRFRREAHTAAELTEPHVIPIHGFGEIDGRLYVDMRLIDGHDLQKMLEQGPLDPEKAVNIISQVASALEAAHRIGLVHRDVKPSNIIVAENDFAYLIDFGIARGANETRLTTTGSAMGTLAYMAPERFTTEDADARSDTYSLACVLHECLTGDPPYPGESFEQQIAGHMVAPPPRPSQLRPGVPAAFDEVIAKGMAKSPDDRYASPSELAAAARAALHAPLAPTMPMTWPQTTPLAGPPATAPAPSYFQQATEAAPYSPAGAASSWAPTQYWTPTQPPAGPPPSGPIVGGGVRTQPWWQRHAVALTAVCAVVVTAVAVPIIWATSRSTADNSPSLLSVKDANTLMGRSDLQLIDKYTELQDPYYSVSPAECDPVERFGDKAMYSAAGIANITAEDLSQTGNRGKESVDQLLGEAPSAAAARQFLADMVTALRPCDGKEFESSGSKVTAKITDTGPDTATVLLDVEGNFVGGKSLKCEHSFGVSGDAVAEVFACADNVEGKTKTIIEEIFQQTKH